MATVQDAANAYAEAEKHLRKAQKELEKIPATYKSLFDEGTLGFNKYRTLTTDIGVVVGKIASVEGAVMKKHDKDTKEAQKLGIDVGPALAADDIQIMDGGSR